MLPRRRGQARRRDLQAIASAAYVVDLTGRKPARIRARSGSRLSARSKAFSPIQNNSDL